jgi:hypothetical protein
VYGIERAAERRVVDPVEDVALRVVDGEDRLVHDLDGVAALLDREGVPGLGLELLHQLLVDRERVVGDHHHLVALVVGTCNQAHREEDQAEQRQGSRRAGSGVVAHLSRCLSWWLV